MPQIAIINPNTEQFESLKLNNFQFNSLKDILQKHVNLINMPEVSDKKDENFICEIAQKFFYDIDLPSNEEHITIKIDKCYETTKYTYFVIYHPINKEYEQTQNTNFLGRYIIENHEPMEYKCIIIKTYNNENIDITFEDLCDIFKSRLIHRAIHIYPNNDIREITFVHNPIENTCLTEKNSRCVQIDFLNRCLCVFLEYEPSINYLNKYPTLLCKKLKIHGSVIISMLLKEPYIENVDLDKNTFKKILSIITNASSSQIDLPLERLKNENFYFLLDGAAKKFEYQINENIPPDVLDSVTMNSTL